MEGKIEVWPLRLVDLKDPEHFELLYGLLSDSPHVVHYYLTEVSIICFSSFFSLIHLIYLFLSPLFPLSLPPFLFPPFLFPPFLSSSQKIVFPDVMRHQGLKISASGQELGGEMIFSRRLGFSGTPSDLLPLELGECHFEKGSDGKMVHFLTSRFFFLLSSLFSLLSSLFSPLFIYLKKLFWGNLT